MKNKLLYLIAIALFFLPKINYGQAPNLGTMANFALFTSAGAITNTGISQITGNVGSNIGASTNFGNINGVMHTQNSTTAIGAADLLTAYNQLAATTATNFPSSSLGNGDTLTAGVYSISAATTLSSNLYLNAQGNPNAVFVFKIQGTFSTGTNAKIKLINGAMACRVFWKIEGAVNMAVGTYMRGTIIANNAAISMSAGDTLEGRALSTVGAVAVSGVMVYNPIGCGSPYLTGPAAPNLATIANYALFSSTGSVTNSGTSTITGDVGTNSGLTTGFNPLLVNGIIHPIPDVSTAQCAADLTNVYTYLNTLPFQIQLLYPAQFGKNLVLTPHTYLLNAATSFTDSLYLNAQGNANAVFVIKINGALTTSTFSRVILMNGTQSRNVYWVVNGAVSINNNSVFRGTIVANNGAVLFNTGATLDGRAFSTAGSVTVSGLTATANNAPYITQEPINKAVCFGDSIKIGVKATGTALTYQWRKGNVNLSNGANISGVTTDTLRFVSVTYADTATNYNVIVYGTFAPNDTSNNVSLKIDSTINIIALSTEITTCPGVSVEMNVEATGAGLTYQWRKGGIDMVNTSRITGVLTNKLNFNPAISSDASSDYSVIIRGSCAMPDTSNNVVLVINNPPNIVTEPTNKTACEGDTVKFSVQSIGAGLTYQWRKGTVDLVSGGNILDATSAILAIYPVTFADTANNYNVKITGECEPVDSSIYVSLFINSVPIVITEPINQSVCIGNTATFIVKATGTALTYRWRKGNANLINGGNIIGVTNDTLTINAINVSDTSSKYNVIVSGFCSAKDTSINVSLLISAPPVITTEPVSQSICSGGTQQFIVAATGTGLTYQWRRGNVNLTNTLNVSGVNNDTLLFNTVGIADTANNYNVIVFGACNPTDTSVNISLLFNNPPIITTEPINQAACLGTSARFIVTTSGLGVTYQWRKGNVNLINGLNISGVTNDTLTFNTTTFADTASNYNVIVSGTCNPKDTSINVSLLINNPTLILTEPNSQTTCIGNSANFVVTASGVGLTYQWRRGNVNVINGGNISGANTSTLSFSAVTLLDIANNYNVIVNGTCNPKDTSINVSIIINTPAIISVQPTSQTICNGSSASFVVSATGTGLTYQWRRGNINLINFGNISGANSSTLTINPVTTADTNNTYNVIVSGSCNPNDTSSNVSLAISTSPIIITEPITQNTCIGSSVSFNINATGTALTYQWRKGNVNLINFGNISGVNSSTLTINPTTLIDAANNYNVIVSGTCNPKDTSINASLIINTSSIVSVQPTSQTICEGGSAGFIVTATGTGLTYQWRKGNVNLINFGNISGANSSILTINPAGVTDASTLYNVVVSGACSTKDSSSNVALIINTAPVIVTEPINQTTCIGNSASFNVNAIGSNLIYQWRKGLLNLLNAGNISGANSATLTINPVNLTDITNNYNVIVSGTCTPKDSSINVALIISSPPVISTQPTNQTTCVGSATSFTLTTTGTGLTYQWRKGNVNLVNGGNISGATTNNLIINPTSLSDATANYNVIVTNICAFKDTSINASLIVNTLPIAIASSNSPVCEGKSLKLTAQTVAGATYLWNGPNSFATIAQNPTIVSASLADSGNYTLEINQNGCNSILVNLKVIVKTCADAAFSIPEGFSPNGDGINDLFVINEIVNYPTLSMNVYNRWGSLVFEASPYKNTWNGKSNSGVTIGGDDLPIGTYFYIIDLGNGSPILKGTIYLNK